MTLTEFLDDLETIMNSITTPIILCGDINAHHPMWEASRTIPDHKGQLVMDFLNNQDLIITNDGSPTLPAINIHHSDTAPDITATTPTLATRITWHTSPDPLSSDHRPIHIAIGHDTTPIITQPRLNMKKAKWTEFTDQMEQIDLEHPTVDEFTDIIKKAAQDNIPTTKPIQRPRRSAPWWNYECKRAITLRDTARKRYERNKSQDNLINYKRARARCRRLVREAKKSSFQEVANTFNRYTPITKIWKTIKAYTGQKTPINKATLIINNSTTYTTPEEITQQFAEHYNRVASNCPPPIPLTIREQLTDNQPYNKPFTLAEMEDAIGRTGNTAPGPDTIHYHCYKHLGEKGKRLLLKALNHSFTTHHYPESWFHAFIIPIPKPQKPTT